MPRYRYTGTDSAGRRVEGEREAPDPDALLTAIAGEVLFVDSVQPVADSGAGRRASARMNQSEAAEVSRHIAELVESELPLEAGLSAIAAECTSWKKRSTLNRIARDLATGNRLEAVLSERGAPPELQALVRAGARSGNTGRVLEHYVLNVQGAAELRQTVLGALAYPLLVLMLIAAIGIPLTVWLIPQFADIFNDFDLDLPIMTMWLLTASTFVRDHGFELAAGVLAVVVIGILVLRGVFGPVGFRRLICAVPLLGPILRWSALTRFSHLLSLLIENDVPLDEALALAGNASGDIQIQDDCRRMLAGVTAGESLESAARKAERFPATFVQALSWECRTEGLPEVLQSLGDMYAGRVRAAVAVLVALLPPLLMVFLTLLVGFVVVALFMPLIELLNKLS